MCLFSIGGHTTGPTHAQIWHGGPHLPGQVIGYILFRYLYPQGRGRLKSGSEGPCSLATFIWWLLVRHNKTLLSPIRSSIATSSRQASRSSSSKTSCPVRCWPTTATLTRRRASRRCRRRYTDTRAVTSSGTPSTLPSMIASSSPAVAAPGPSTSWSMPSSQPLTDSGLVLAFVSLPSDTRKTMG